MQKLYKKDSLIRVNKEKIDIKLFIEKNINKNTNFQKTLKWSIFNKIKTDSSKSSGTKLNNWCQQTFNKKIVNKISYYCRHKLLKIVRKGYVTGIRKSCW
jgi:ribosomal protein S14